MATPTVADLNKQMWDEALTRLLDLSTVTIKRNAELEARVTELEVELSVWKQAHTNVLEAAERDKKTHNARVATLNKQLSSGLFKNQNPLVLCVIDGDANVFNPSLIAEGHKGGRLAAQELTKGIAEFLAQEEVQVFGRLSFWVTVYLHKRGLLSMLQSENICSADQFEAFITGLSQASPRFSIVDVGPGDGADVKIKEYLQTYISLPQTLRVFFGGGQDGSYGTTFAAIEKDDSLGKIVLLHGANGPSENLQQLSLPIMQTEGLFMTNVPGYAQRRPSHIPLSGFNNNVMSESGLISPQSEPQSSAPSPTSRATYGKRLIDPTKPLHKQNPPPCNEHYLMTCTKGVNCKYSHDWLLTSEQLEVLAKNAKKAPCNYLKNGVDCPYGDRCCWGHVCPGGARCFHLSKGKCWFKGEDMHPPLSAQDY
ncbi:uncharacterized protein LAESUDRAFT_808368 [Laetiporus sulphureus 93-53]|uniref:C3H1-type domain-containing protein n=1 Tax=Laetiporus sulphureus 93-53 TaxID=1314785 RepID=A0A165IBB9_9APHY|nr:uncharacterized protein LAESUDRAFT_808368 [Laetiporus sulphureus 93-53]KZT12842.1 hypothetical protein LAESUDRAFT_808368 [Laetiporus sulphureus 93-53]